MLARRNLIAAAGVVSLSVAAAAAGAASDRLTGGEESELVESQAMTVERAIERQREIERRRARRRPKWASADPDKVAGTPRGTLDAIASCESGGDPRAVSSDGTYRGKYQFDKGTWATVGGKGDPAKAPEAEQDYRAGLLYKRSGSNPWPVCG